MKKSANRWKMLSWLSAIFCASLVLIWSTLPRLLESFIQSSLHESGTILEAVAIDKFNPWILSLGELKIGSEDANISVKELEARYDPLSLSKGKIHALSVTSPKMDVNISQIVQKLNAKDEDLEDGIDIGIQAEEFLSNPPLQFLRLRDASMVAKDGDYQIQSIFSAEGDFHKGLAQIRMDGNFTGVPWLADITMIQEGSDLFLGSALQVTDLRNFTQSISNLFPLFQDGLELDLSEWVVVDHGSAKGQWTGRIQDDGIMDQFLDFNVSNLSLQCLGLSLNIPQAILFVTPHSPSWIESNFYANLNWGENLQVKGLKISSEIKDGQPTVDGRIQRLQTTGVLPNTEIVGLIIDDVEFAYDEEGEFLGVRHANLRFSALHLEEGLFNLYDGEISLDWLGEDRFHIELKKASGSFPTVGLNLYNLGYEGEIAIDSFPLIEKKQTITIEEAFLGEDQKIEDLLIDFNLDSMERIEFSSVQMGINDLEFSFDPANLVVEFPESEKEGLNLAVMEGELQFADFEDFTVKNIIGNIKLNSLDPIESNGTQSIRFDLRAGEELLKNGEVSFDLLPTGEKIIETIELYAFDGQIFLEKTKIEESLDGLELGVVATGLSSQKLIALFEDLDARMDGNLSGALNIRNDSLNGWDFYSGALSLDSSDSAKLFLNTQGMLTEGLESGSSEYKNMYLLERALENLNLDAMNIVFKISDNGNRVVEMNIRGESEVDGKDISVEYRPKIIGGLEALIQQADLSKWGITP